MDGTEHPAPGSAGGRSGVGEGKESGRGVAEAQWADLPLDRQVALLQADIEGWRRRVECLEATLDTARNSAGEDIRLLDELRRQRDYARAELDVTGAAFEALRNAHHIPYADEDHQGGNCADIVIGLVAARMKVESSRRAWAEEAMRLEMELDVAAGGEAAAALKLSSAMDLLERLVDREECWYDHHGGCQAHGFLEPEPGAMCPHAEAKQFLTRPVCAVHEEGPA